MGEFGPLSRARYRVPSGESLYYFRNFRVFVPQSPCLSDIHQFWWIAGSIEEFLDSPQTLGDRAFLMKNSFAFRPVDIPVDAARLGHEKAFVEQIGPTVRAVLRHKSGMGLDMRDGRSENHDALDLYHDVMMRLWERMAWVGPRDSGMISDARAYAASVAHNAWSDHLRHKYPNRTSLKNRLRHVLNQDEGFALWADATGEWLAARADSLGDRMTRARMRGDHARVASLRIGLERPPAGTAPARSFDTMQPGDWRRLLGAILDHVRGPIAIDDLVSVCAALLDVQESHAVRFDDEREAMMSVPSSPGSEPHGIAQTRSMLRRLWVLVQQLPPHYRLAYLLNIPGPGKSRGDIEVLLLEGVATIDQIEASLGLDDGGYRLLASELEGVDPHATALVQPGGPSERFVQLWRHLPLADTLIARLLGLRPQQVINRRMLALRRLAKGFGQERRKDRMRR